MIKLVINLIHQRVRAAKCKDKNKGKTWGKTK
jgi:hypothetical protein